MVKRDLVNELKDSMQSLGDEYSEDDDLMGSVWLPVVIDQKELQKKEEILSDPNVKEMDLAKITEKEVYVRKADLVSLRYINTNREILRRV